MRYKTKWIVLGRYSFGGSDYIVFVRGSRKTGLLDFKIKKIGGIFTYTHPILPHDLVNVTEQWNKIINLIK